MKSAVLAVFAAVAPLPALAQATAESNSQSGANSQVILEGSKYERHAPGLGGIGGNSTAACVASHGAGVVFPGGGVMFGTATIEEHCLTRTEAAMLRDLLDMPRSRGRQAAVYHACKFSERLQDTLVAMGECVVKRVR